MFLPSAWWLFIRCLVGGDVGGRFLLLVLSLLFLPLTRNGMGLPTVVKSRVILRRGDSIGL